MIKGLKKALLMGGLVLVEGTYTGGNFNSNSNEKEMLENIKKTYETYESSNLEEKISEGFYLTPDSLNKCIKQAYSEVQKWPKEFDKRLYRLMLKQESNYNVYARNKWSGASGIGQIMPDTYKGYRDSTNLETEIFNPINNIGVSLEVLNDISIFCKKYHPKWNNLNLEDKRKVILTCYNAGPGKVRDKAKWDLQSKKLNKEQREYADIIMGTYHNPEIKVELN
jgi:soluble lytic murein transglycosylase-like protein